MKLITANIDSELSRAKKGLPASQSGTRERIDLGDAKPVTAAFSNMGSYTSTMYGGDTDFYLDFLDNPLMQSSNLYLPYDRRILNAWLRYWDATHPLLGSLIDLHATYPFSRFEYSAVDDPAVSEIYQTAHDKVKLFQRLLEMIREYWLIGEFIAFKGWDDKLGIWDSLHLLDPDSVEVEGDIMIDPEDLDYYWVPPEMLRETINQATPYAERVREKLDPAVITAIESGTEIPLDKFSISHVARRGNPYQARGQSIVLRCLKTLNYEEDLVSAQRQIAKRHIFPLQIYKIGDIANNYIPSEGDLEAFRNVLMSISHDPNKAIIYHDALEVDFQGTAGQLLDLDREFERTEQRILTALFTNKAFVTGDGPTYSNATVAARMLSSRYITVRHLVEDFIRDDFCKPIAIAHDMYKEAKVNVKNAVRVSKKWGRKEVQIQTLAANNESFYLRNGKFVGSSVRYKGFWYRVESRDGDQVVLSTEDSKKLNIPDIKWHSKINLVDDMENKQLLFDLFREGHVPFKVVAESLDLNIREVEKSFYEEKNTVFDPYVKQVLRSLAEDAEMAVPLLDEYSKLVVQKAKDRGIDIEGIFPKVEKPEDTGDGGGTFGSADLLTKPLDKLSLPDKMKKLSTLSQVAGLDPKIKAAIKQVTSKLAKEVRSNAMTKSPEKVSSPPDSDDAEEDHS